MFLVLAPGCRPSDAPAPAAQAAPGKPAPRQEIWDAFFLQGAKIGYGQTVVEPAAVDGRDLVCVRSDSHLAITRFNQRTEQNVQAETLETPAGEVLQFKTEVAFGPSPTVATGRVEGDQMAITVTTQGRSATARIPWSPEVRGFRGIEQSLAGQPMQPGETRSLRMLVPVVNEVAAVELAARDLENTRLLGIEARLLRIDAVTKLSSGAIQSTLWTDPQGEVIKTRIAALEQESIRTTRALATAPGGSQKEFDLGLDLIVKVDPPLATPHETRKVRYRVTPAYGNVAETFAEGPTQSVRTLDDGSAEITVTSLRPGQLSKPAEPPAAVGPEYTSANSILQVDDPLIQQMARQAKGTATAPADVAIALERFVHRAVGEKNFSHGFATAAEVAASREGDCTEHAVLLAALARACGIPSRVAIGLVYVERLGGFGYHMWTEVHIDGRWVPLDGIMGQGGTSAAYLKLTDTSLAGASAYGSLLAVAGVLGRLKVSVIESQ
jgi:hypothetical protein